MGVVSIAVKLETMVADDVSKGKHIEDEKEGAKHRSLGDTLGDVGCAGFAVVDVDVLVSVGKV